MKVSAGKNVLIIVENLPVPFDRRVWQEATSLRNAGYQVCIICPTGKNYSKKYEEIKGIHIYRHPLLWEGNSPLTYLLEYGNALCAEFFLSLFILFRHGFDLIHACNPPDLIFLVGGFFKILLRKKFIFDHHDINPELYLSKFRRKDLFYRLLLFLEKFTFKTADVSIATNESYKKIALERGGMSPGRVFVVRSGPSLERLYPVPAQARWKRGKKYLVGYVGVMGKQEGIDLLLEGIHHLVYNRGRKDIHFVLVGAGTELPELERLTRHLQVEEYVTFPGRVPDEVLREILSTAEVCINPDRVDEMNDKSTMNKIMEYMALGKPIVQFEMTEGRFSAGEASLYAKPNDARDLIEKTIHLLDNPDERHRRGEFGRQKVEKELKWEYERLKLLAVYKKIAFSNN